MSHGHTIGGVASPTYNTWINMVRRCLDTRSSKFHQYGGVGITVCDRWLKFEQFLADMGKRPEGCTLDRIDGTLGYSPDNCRWADIRTQQRNTKSNVYIEFRGDRRCVAEWAEMLGLDKTLLAWRIRKGWTPDEALTIPPKRGNRVKRLHT